jgi:hypothetical protein
MILIFPGLITWMNFFALGKFAARFQIAATLAKLVRAFNKLSLREWNAFQLACALIILTGFYYMFALDWNEGLREPMANSRSTLQSNSTILNQMGYSDIF